MVALFAIGAEVVFVNIVVTINAIVKLQSGKPLEIFPIPDFFLMALNAFYLCMFSI